MHLSPKSLPPTPLTYFPEKFLGQNRQLSSVLFVFCLHVFGANPGPYGLSRAHANERDYAQWVLGAGYVVALESGIRRRTHREREWGLEILWRVGGRACMGVGTSVKLSMH